MPRRLVPGNRPGHHVGVRLSSQFSLILLGGTLAALVFGLAACGGSGGCGGQCGPRFQAQVFFRPGTSTQTAATGMGSCAWKPFVIRVGRVYRFRGPKAIEPPGTLTATVYTESMLSHQNDRLLACLRRLPSVTSAGYPD